MLIYRRVAGLRLIPVIPVTPSFWLYLIDDCWRRDRAYTKWSLCLPHGTQKISRATRMGAHDQALFGHSYRSVATNENCGLFGWWTLTRGHGNSTRIGSTLGSTSVHAQPSTEVLALVYVILLADMGGAEVSSCIRNVEVL